MNPRSHCRGRRPRRPAQREALSWLRAAKDLAPGRGRTFLLLVQKKGTKENDTREGKISISPPPWTLPHSNDQTGLASPFWNSLGMPLSPSRPVILSAAKDLAPGAESVYPGAANHPAPRRRDPSSAKPPQDDMRGVSRFRSIKNTPRTFALGVLHSGSGCAVSGEVRLNQ